MANSAVGDLDAACIMSLDGTGMKFEVTQKRYIPLFRKARLTH